MAAAIGVNDVLGFIEEKQAGAQTIEGVGEACGFGGLEIDHPPDHGRILQPPRQVIKDFRPRTAGHANRIV
jgi:hypothetical protein